MVDWIQVTLDCSIVYPGQDVALHVFVDNQSNSVVKYLKATLVQVLSFDFCTLIHLKSFSCSSICDLSSFLLNAFLSLSLSLSLFNFNSIYFTHTLARNPHTHALLSLSHTRSPLSLSLIHTHTQTQCVCFSIKRDTTYEKQYSGKGKRNSVKTKVHSEAFIQGSRFPLSPYHIYDVSGLHSANSLFLVFV